MKITESQLNKLIGKSIREALENDFDNDLDRVKPNMMLNKSQMRPHNGFDEYINRTQDPKIVYYVCPFKAAVNIMQHNAFGQQYARQQVYGMGVYAFIDKETAMRDGRYYGDTVIAVKITGPGAKVHEEMGLVVIPYKIAKPIAMMTFAQLTDFPAK